MPLMLSPQTWWRRSWSASWTSWTKRTDYLNPATSTLLTLFTTNTRTTSASLWVALKHEEEVVPLKFTRENRDRQSEQLENRTRLMIWTSWTNVLTKISLNRLLTDERSFIWIIFSDYHSLTTISLINQQHRVICELCLPWVSSLRTHTGWGGLQPERETSGSTERSTSTFKVFIWRR